MAQQQYIRVDVKLHDGDVYRYRCKNLVWIGTWVEEWNGELQLVDPSLFWTIKGGTQDADIVEEQKPGTTEWVKFIQRSFQISSIITCGFSEDTPVPAK